MDPFNDRPDLEPVTLALTRHPATGERRGSLVMNPGGPGGSGLEAAWGIRPGMPADVLRAYDVVSWDPRGIGSSLPSIDCGEDPDPNTEDFMQGCADGTGDLAGFLSAPYSAADLESIRVALGEEQLDYLGYSYGTIIGAMFAARQPERVGNFVLDGTTDPLVGGDDGASEDGFPYYADDGTPAATERFMELCDQSDACLGDRCRGDVGAVRRTRLDGRRPPDRRLRRRSRGRRLVHVRRCLPEHALVRPGLAAVRHRTSRRPRRRRLDAGRARPRKTRSCPRRRSPNGPGRRSRSPTSSSTAPTSATRSTGRRTAIRFPRNEFTITPIESIDVDRPVLVIGTEFDPVTPGYHAAEFADALGDAVHIIWEGVGHTAFPASSRCIDDIVADQLLDGPLPEDGHAVSVRRRRHRRRRTRRRSVHATTVRRAAGWIARTLEIDGLDADTATCVGQAVVRASDDRTISHVVLGVESDRRDIGAARRAENSC